MGVLHNTIIIGPDGVRYLVQKIDDVKISPGNIPSENIEKLNQITSIPEESSTPELSPIGHKIRNLRKIKKWSQAQLGRKAGGITQATISNIESGHTDAPHAATIEILLKVLAE